tara:strand:- start:1916 stop:2548 length:633 start_codon:yes stop_codon:yes gene_type:complete
MTFHVATSDPTPSARNPGWDFIYFDKKSASGRDCTALVRPYLRNHIRKGFRFLATSLLYDHELRQDVLQAPAPAQHLEEPSLPADQDAGWGDDDSLLAEPAAYDHYQAAPMNPNPSMPTPGSSPAAQRREHVAARDAALGNHPPHRLSLEAIAAADEAAGLYLYLSRRLGIRETARPMEVQKMATSILIQLYKARGIPLSPEDEKAMMFS